MTNLKKKVICLISMLSLCMIVALHTNVMVASAAETENGLVYEVDKGVVVITGYNGSEENLVIPEKIKGYSVYEIADDVFANNEVVKSVTVPKTVEKIGVTVFAGCTRLTTVKILGPIEELPYATFGWCHKLKTVQLANGLLKIDDYAFSECENLTSVNMPTSLKTIGARAFEKCKKLKTISIPKNVEYVDSDFDSVFNECISLTKINVDSNNKKYASVDGVVFTKDKIELLYCPEGKTGEYTVPKGVECIGYASLYRSQLSKVVIPEGVKKIEYMAFSDTDILEIVMPASIEEINDYAFDSDDKVVLYCKKSSVAHEFAKNNNYRYDLQHYLINYTATIKQSTFSYTGNSIKPVVTVKGKFNGKTVTLKNGTDYKVTYKNNKNSGKATIIIKGIGDYVGELNLSFSIVPKPIKSFTFSGRTASSVTLKWAKNANADGYVIEQYKGGKWTTIKTITKNTTVKYKVTNLKPSVNYKFRIKAYNKAGSSKVYSAYSTKSVKTLPSTVKGFVYKARTAKTITLKWTKNTSADGYVVQQYKGGKWVTIKTVTNKSTVNYKVTGLKKNTSYKFRIKAYKKDGSKKLYSISYTNKTVQTLAK